ncbi:MAG: sigma-70 domain-containing protein [Thermofilum sp.]
MIEALAMEWKRTKDPRLFQQIFSQIYPMVKRRVRDFYGSGVAEDVLELEARKLVAEALERYDGRSNLHSYIQSYLQGLSRFVNKYQAVFRLPENYNLEYATFQRAFFDLSVRLGRDPTATELADELGWNVEKVNVYLRRRVGVEDFEAAPPMVHSSESLKVKEARAYIASRYGRDAEALLAMTKGLDGPKVSLAEAARRLNMNYYQARRLLEKVERDFNDFLS